MSNSENFKIYIQVFLAFDEGTLLLSADDTASPWWLFNMHAMLCILKLKI